MLTVLGNNLQVSWLHSRSVRKQTVSHLLVFPCAGSLVHSFLTKEDNLFPAYSSTTYGKVMQPNRQKAQPLACDFERRRGYFLPFSTFRALQRNGNCRTQRLEPICVGGIS